MLKRDMQVEANDTGTIKVSRTCRVCAKVTEIDSLPAADFQDWLEGKAIQEAFPYLPPASREILIYGMHSECFDKEYPE